VGKVIAAHAVMFLEMADDGLNGGTPFELALDLRRDAALLALIVAAHCGRPFWTWCSSICATAIWRRSGTASVGTSIVSNAGRTGDAAILPRSTQGAPALHRAADE
jgi:hypothetical protein